MYMLYVQVFLHASTSNIQAMQLKMRNRVVDEEGALARGFQAASAPSRAPALGCHVRC